MAILSADIRPDPMTPWLTQGEAAKRARVSVSTIQAERARGNLHYSGGGPGGRRVLIHQDWLDEWIEDRARRRRRNRRKARR